MADPVIPANQQDSFPIVSVTGAQQATETRIIGGTVLKYWGPAATGITNAAVPVGGDANGHRFLATNYLDMTGISVGAALVSRFDSVANPVATPAFQLFMQYRLDKTTTMPTSLVLLGGINLPQCGMKPIHTTAFAFAASPATPAGTMATEYALITWGPSTDAGSGVADNLAQVTIVSDVRIFISFSTNVLVATNRFSLSIWGSS